MGVLVARQQRLGVGEQVDRVVVGDLRGGTQMGQGRRRLVLHQQQLAEGAPGEGVAGLQHHRFLQWRPRGGRVPIPQGRDPQGHLGVDVAGIELHSIGSSMELASIWGHTPLPSTPLPP